MFSRIGVIGAGAMGRGIALLFATAGQKVYIYDTRSEAIDQALAFNRELLERNLAKGKIDQAQFGAILERMQPATTLEALAECDLLVEAIVELLEVKQKLFVELEAIVPKSTVLATNTSSLSVTAIASACKHPERVAGFHFFNPVVLMKLVEVVKGERTADEVIERLVALAQGAGHFAAVTPDTPGFLVNHAGRAYATEAQRMLVEGIAEPAQIDRILRDGPGFPMGPFELADLTGLDISHAVMESIFSQYYGDARYTPSNLAAQRVAGGVLGRKTGQGYYRYEDGKMLREPEPCYEPVLIDRPFWLDSTDSELRANVRAVLAVAGAVLEEGTEPSATAICLITPLGEDVSQYLSHTDLPPKRTLALDPLVNWDKRRVLMRHPALTPEILAQARQALSADSVPVEVINDSPGFVIQRMIASIVNLGCELLQRQVTDPQTLERAIPLALGYPKGPLGFAEQYGADVILTILHGMQQSYGFEPRYRPSPWLRRRVQLKLALTAPEA